MKPTETLAPGAPADDGFIPVVAEYDVRRLEAPWRECLMVEPLSESCNWDPRKESRGIKHTSLGSLG